MNTIEFERKYITINKSSKEKFINNCLLINLLTFSFLTISHKTSTKGRILVYQGCMGIEEGKNHDHY